MQSIGYITAFDYRRDIAIIRFFELPFAKVPFSPYRPCEWVITSPVCSRLPLINRFMLMFVDVFLSVDYDKHEMHLRLDDYDLFKSTWNELRDKININSP